MTRRDDRTRARALHTRIQHGGRVCEPCERCASAIYSLLTSPAKTHRSSPFFHFAAPPPTTLTIRRLSCLFVGVCESVQLKREGHPNHPTPSRRFHPLLSLPVLYLIHWVPAFALHVVRGTLRAMVEGRQGDGVCGALTLEFPRGNPTISHSHALREIACAFCSD